LQLLHEFGVHAARPGPNADILKRLGVYGNDDDLTGRGPLDHPKPKVRQRVLECTECTTVQEGAQDTQDECVRIESFHVEPSVRF
jgi:hypothetical protein